MIDGVFLTMDGLNLREAAVTSKNLRKVSLTNWNKLTRFQIH